MGSTPTPGTTSQVGEVLFRRSVEKRLKAVTDEARRLRQELLVLDEQLLQVVDEAEDSRLRSLVSETPLAAAEHRDATRAAAALQRDRDAIKNQLEELEAKQDQLLDQLQERQS